VKELLKHLTETFGPSGSEEQIREEIKREMADLVDRIETDALGNLFCVREGGTGGKRVMLAAHMDEIGVMVTHVDGKGFLRFTPVGGIAVVNLLGSRVVFSQGQMATISREWPKTRGEREALPSIERMYLDMGASQREDIAVQVGDAAAFYGPFVDLGARMLARNFDDRAGCAVLIQVARDLEECPHQVHFVFTVQEELGLRGAVTSSYSVQPEVALAVDVTATGDTPEARTMAVSLGGGPAIKVKDRGMLTHPGVRQLMIETAEGSNLPYQREILDWGTTDAMAMQVSRAGVPVGVLSIPSRYVHSPSQMVDLSDLENSVKLLLELLRGSLEF
jgi:endoglucanase